MLLLCLIPVYFFVLRWQTAVAVWLLIINVSYSLNDIRYYARAFVYESVGERLDRWSGLIPVLFTAKPAMIGMDSPRR